MAGSGVYVPMLAREQLVKPTDDATDPGGQA
jgi:hypothetical protein